MYASRGGEQRLSEVTRDDWVCKTHHYQDSHTSGKHASVCVCACVCDNRVHLALMHAS